MFAIVTSLAATRKNLFDDFPKQICRLSRHEILLLPGPLFPMIFPCIMSYSGEYDTDLSLYDPDTLEGVNNVHLFLQSFELWFVSYLSCPRYFELSPIDPHFECSQFFIGGFCEHPWFYAILRRRLRGISSLIFVSKDMLWGCDFWRWLSFCWKPSSPSLWDILSCTLSQCSFITIPR